MFVKVRNVIEERNIIWNKEESILLQLIKTNSAG